MSNQQPASNHRSLTGFVTKLVGDGATYGFINDEIFFPQTAVSDGPASVGDQVFAECEYSAHLPIKWNANSVKILNKAAGHQQRPDLQQQQQQQQQQDMMNQQQFGSNNPVAVTYQQHRQQRQQRQTMDVDSDNNNPHGMQSMDQSKMLDSGSNPADFYGNRPFPMQPDSNIQPFPDQPMGPPNFTYTSQLGSAFVQNQFVPTPFLPQQPPPMLPQQQQPQHLLPTTQIHNQNNQRHNNNQHNKGPGNRFNNNHNEKNDRQNNRRNQNRNDNKFDRPRSGERDNSSHNRSSKSNGSRERSIGRNAKRDEVASRISPPSHSTVRSTSINSDRGTKGRRHYEVQNIPKTRILTNMDAHNMKQRCPSSLHVPSDLKDVIVNKYFRLDLKNTPKPIRFIIEQLKNEAKSDDKKGSKVKEQATEKVEVKGETDSISNNTSTAQDKKVSEENKSDKQLENPTPPSSRSDIRLNHKYGVKVILLSLADLDKIYHEVFSSNLDSFTSDTKSHKRLDETISLLCNRGSNNGHSLIGGKFDPTLDGFVEGEIDDYERQGRKPDLIATCKRAVLEATGLDLGECRNWSLLSTFIYNHKSDYFSPKASIEYSFIYMPHIWTMLSDKFDKDIIAKETDEPKEVMSANKEKELQEPQTDPQKVKELPETQTDSQQVKEVTEDQPPATANIDSVEELTPVTNQQVGDLSLERLNELKVSDLKAELDNRGIKYKGVAKKAELVAILQEHLQMGKVVIKDESTEQEDVRSSAVIQSDVELKPNVDQSGDVDELKPDAAVETNQSGIENPDVKEETGIITKSELKMEPETSDNDQKEKHIADDASSQLEEGEVLTADNSPLTESCEMQSESELSCKRKASTLETEGSDTKKFCSNEPQKDPKEARVDLVKDSFVVRSRLEQQQLSLVSLFEATQGSRHDQFELSVASSILKESLIQHLSEYILTTLIEDHKHRTSTSNSGGSSSGSQETCSDSNNNSSKSTFKNPTSSDPRLNLKEYPVGRYINLAFSYFDSAHMGYMYLEDLNKLFNCTGLTISKRAMMSLVGDGDKFQYRTLPDLSPKLDPTYVYEYPPQFNRQLIGLNSQESSSSVASKVIEYKGITYNVEKLIQQVRDADTLRVSLVDRFNYAIENSDKQAEEIHVLEVSQKSLAKAIKAQNDEICDLKRERDSLKKKFDNVRKGIKGTISSLSDLIKEDK